MSQIALILHGWPGARTAQSIFYRYFSEKGYKVLVPDLFSRKFVFTPDNITSEIIRRLGGEKLNVAMGISLGGLILPYIAKEFPETKLIFIATGPYLRTRSNFLNLIFWLVRHKWILKILSLSLLLPTGILAFFYRLASPFSGTNEQKREYEKDMLQNIEQIRSIPPAEEAEILDFIYKIDNTHLLKEIKNLSLIFNGRKDLFMPARRGDRLHELLQNSKLIINEGEHFDVFTQKDLAYLDNFLRSD